MSDWPEYFWLLEYWQLRHTERYLLNDDTFEEYNSNKTTF